MELKKHRRLSYRERVVIQSLLEENKTKSFIAIKFGISPKNLAESFYPYLTLGEGIKLAAITF